METESGSFETFDNQYFPTPPSLGALAFSKFKDKNISRLLEPQAGRGALADIVKNASGYGSQSKCDHIDCVEINLANQAILREMGYRVVGSDFLHYKGASIYSHILMNPPFRYGVNHLMHAWDLLFSGEIVAILNAQDVRNPSTALRRRLVTLISDHGSVEFIQQAFMSEDTQRKTEVEIALIHLEKKSSEYADFIDNLKREVEQKFDPAPPNRSEIVVPRCLIENMVVNFECAVEAAKHAHTAAARATHFAGRIGFSIVEGATNTLKPKYDARSFNNAYDELKERAWSTVLRSSAVLDKLSSQAQRRIEASFKDICTLEFTYDNIWGFLNGLIAQQGQILQDMMCDVFDQFTKHHADNRTYYQGWKSNSKHRLNAFRLKATRIVLPAARRDWYGKFSSSLSWDDELVFQDFDKVFAMLDAKAPENVGGLCALFRSFWKDLLAGARLSSDYFDVRMYAKSGTFHLFPRRKDLIERMNRVVGKARQWLPQDESAVPNAFWQQYEKAEQVIAKAPGLHALELKRQRAWSESEKDEASQQQLEAHQAALETLGIEYDYSMLIEHAQPVVQEVLQIPLLQEDIAA